MSDVKNMISIPKETAEVLFSAAETRWEQYDRFSRGLDPYESDGIYECDVSEAASLAQMYRDAMDAYLEIEEREQ